MLTCRAIGYGFLNSLAESPEALSKQALAYGSALSAVNLALQDPTEKLQDATLTSVWLLGMYEVRIYRPLMRCALLTVCNSLWCHQREVLIMIRQPGRLGRQQLANPVAWTRGLCMLKDWPACSTCVAEGDSIRRSRERCSGW
jgi:hypothetical protein